MSAELEQGFSPGVEQRERQELAVDGLDTEAALEGDVASLDLGLGETLPVLFACSLSLVVLWSAVSMGKLRRASGPYRLSLKLGVCFLCFLRGGGTAFEERSRGLLGLSGDLFIAPLRYVSSWLADCALAVRTMFSSAWVLLMSTRGGRKGTPPGRLGCENAFRPKFANRACCASAGVGMPGFSSLSGDSLALLGVEAAGLGEVVLEVEPSGAISPTKGVAAPGLKAENRGSRPVAYPFLDELK